MSDILPIIDNKDEKTAQLIEAVTIFQEEKKVNKQSSAPVQKKHQNLRSKRTSLPFIENEYKTPWMKWLYTTFPIPHAKTPELNEMRSDGDKDVDKARTDEHGSFDTSWFSEADATQRTNSNGEKLYHLAPASEVPWGVARIDARSFNDLIYTLGSINLEQEIGNRSKRPRRQASVEEVSISVRGVPRMRRIDTHPWTMVPFRDLIDDPNGDNLQSIIQPKKGSHTLSLGDELAKRNVISSPYWLINGAYEVEEDKPIPALAERITLSVKEGGPKMVSSVDEISHRENLKVGTPCIPPSPVEPVRDVSPCDVPAASNPLFRRSDLLREGADTRDLRSAILGLLPSGGNIHATPVVSAPISDIPVTSDRPLSISLPGVDNTYCIKVCASRLVSGGPISLNLHEEVSENPTIGSWKIAVPPDHELIHIRQHFIAPRPMLEGDTIRGVLLVISRSVNKFNIITLHVRLIDPHQRDVLLDSVITDPFQGVRTALVDAISNYRPVISFIDSANIVSSTVPNFSQSDSLSTLTPDRNEDDNTANDITILIGSDSGHIRFYTLGLDGHVTREPLSIWRTLGSTKTPAPRPALPGFRVRSDVRLFTIRSLLPTCSRVRRLSFAPLLADCLLVDAEMFGEHKIVAILFKDMSRMDTMSVKTVDCWETKLNNDKSFDASCNTMGRNSINQIHLTYPSPEECHSSGREGLLVAVRHVDRTFSPSLLSRGDIRRGPVLNGMAKEWDLNIKKMCHADEINERLNLMLIHFKSPADFEICSEQLYVDLNHEKEMMGDYWRVLASLLDLFGMSLSYACQVLERCPTKRQAVKAKMTQTYVLCEVLKLCTSSSVGEVLDNSHILPNSLVPDQNPDWYRHLMKLLNTYMEKGSKINQSYQNPNAKILSNSLGSPLKDIILRSRWIFGIVIKVILPVLEDYHASTEPKSVMALTIADRICLQCLLVHHALSEMSLAAVHCNHNKVTVGIDKWAECMPSLDGVTDDLSQFSNIKQVNLLNVGRHMEDFYLKITALSIISFNAWSREVDLMSDAP
eukprot:GHVH01006926.1.p1 GENE.GHVH01006926.1~~GHVH01006926.1.p1  ORF type:complete len:1044 (-),score=149.34 GHVH01006926.1:556-3660(-)